MAPDPAPPRAGFVGVLPGRVGIVAQGLDDGLLQRWDRWFELASARGKPERLDEARPAWRLAAARGVFGATPTFGAVRLGQDLQGLLYPSAILAQGEPPEPDDPWFDAAVAGVMAATEGATLATVSTLVVRLPRPRSSAPWLLEGAAAVLWRDDWEVHEVRCATAAELVAVPLTLLAEVVLDEEAA